MMIWGIALTFKCYSQNSAPPVNSSVYTIQPQEFIVLHGHSLNAVAYQWYKDNIKIVNAYGKDYTTDLPGVYSVIAFNAEGCPSTASGNVIIKVANGIDTGKTVADVSINILAGQLKTTFKKNLSYTLTASNKSSALATNVLVKLKLSPETNYINSSKIDSNIHYDNDSKLLSWHIDTLGKQNIQLQVMLFNDSHKVISDTATIKGDQFDPVLSNNIATITQETDGLYIPNVFTPNGDGKNDTFTVSGLNSDATMELLIMSKSGNSVFYDKNYQNNWSGDKLPEGTYLYILKIKDSKDSTNVHKGYITLLRSKM